MGRKFMTLMADIGIIILCLPIVAAATAPQLISYQGRLTTPAGAPVPDGRYDLNFRIYDVAAGGAALWHETHSSVPVSSGLFSITLGSVGAPSGPLTAAYFGDTARWLGVTVGLDPEISPRTRLTSAAYAYRVQTVDSARGGAIRGSVDIVDVPQNSNGLEIYSGAWPAVVRIGESSSGDGGAVTIHDEIGASIGRLEADGDGSGAYFELSTGNPMTWFRLDGNYAGTGAPSLLMAGQYGMMELRGDQPGDASIVLPVDAIGAAEIEDEPGVVSSSEGGSLVRLTTAATYTVLRSVTITLPAAGYVFAIATCQPMLHHNTPTASSANFGVSTATNSLPSNQDIGVTLPGAAASGDYNWPVTSQTVFSATSGAHTYYFLGYKGSASTDTIDVYDTQLSIIFIPTTYGSVDPPAPGVGGDDVLAAPAVPQDLALEQSEAIAANNARIAAELAAMKADLAQMKQRLEEGNRKHEND